MKAIFSCLLLLLATTFSFAKSPADSGKESNAVKNIYDFKIKSISGSGELVCYLIDAFPGMFGPTVESLALTPHCDKMLRSSYESDGIYFSDTAPGTNTNMEYYPTENEHLHDDQGEEFDDNVSIGSADSVIPENRASVRYQLEDFLEREKVQGSAAVQR